MYQAPRHLLTVAIATASATLMSPVFADTLDKVQITAQSSAGVDEVISREQLDLRQASDLEDVFSQTPSISVGGSLGVAQKIYLRGIEDTNLNISVDGAVQAGYLFHHQGRVGIEPELLKEVEVQSGAGLATDGAGALGGAVRFTTRDPDDLLRDGEKAGALVKLGYYSNGDVLKTSGTVFGKAGDNVGVLASLTRQQGNAFDDGRGNTINNTETDVDSGFFKLVATPTEQQRLSLSHEIRYDDGERNLRPHFVAAGWNPKNSQESHRKTTTLGYDINPAGDALDIETTFYSTDAYLTQDGADSPKDGAGVKSIGADLRNTLRSGEHTLVFGGDYRRDTGYYINPETPVADEKARVAGLYLQDHYQATSQLLVTAGARYDHYSLDDSDGQSFSNSGISPNLGMEYKLSDALTFNAGYARAMRGPKVKEAYLLGYAVNSASLKEETADNLELGLSYNQGALSLEGTVFVSHIDDFVDRVNRSSVENTGNVKNRGIELKADYEWDKTMASLSFSHSRPELDGEPLSDGDMSVGTATGNEWVADVQHQLPAQNLTLGWSGTFVHRLTKVATGRAEKPGYSNHDVYVRWLPTATDDLSLTLTVNNLFDKQYLDHASYGVSTDSGDVIGLPEAGRDIRLSLAARF